MHPTFCCRICRNQWGTKNEWIYFFKTRAFVDKASDNFQAFQYKPSRSISLNLEFYMWTHRPNAKYKFWEKVKISASFCGGSVQELRALLVPVRSLAADQHQILTLQNFAIPLSDSIRPSRWDLENNLFWNQQKCCRPKCPLFKVDSWALGQNIWSPIFTILFSLKFGGLIIDPLTKLTYNTHLIIYNITIQNMRY